MKKSSNLLLIGFAVAASLAFTLPGKVSAYTTYITSNTDSYTGCSVTWRADIVPLSGPHGGATDYYAGYPASVSFSISSYSSADCASKRTSFFGDEYGVSTNPNVTSTGGANQSPVVPNPPNNGGDSFILYYHLSTGFISNGDTSTYHRVEGRSSFVAPAMRPITVNVQNCPSGGSGTVTAPNGETYTSFPNSSYYAYSGSAQYFTLSQYTPTSGYVWSGTDPAATQASWGADYPLTFTPQCSQGQLTPSTTPVVTISHSPVTSASSPGGVGSAFSITVAGTNYPTSCQIDRQLSDGSYSPVSSGSPADPSAQSTYSTGIQNYTVSTTTTFRGTCTNGGGSGSNTTTIYVGSGTPCTGSDCTNGGTAPTVTVNTSPASFASPSSSNTSTVSWTSTGAVSCDANSWSSGTGTSGSAQVTNIQTTTTYTKVCHAADGTAGSGSGTVTVGSTPQQARISVASLETDGNGSYLGTVPSKWTITDSSGHNYGPSSAVVNQTFLVPQCDTYTLSPQDLSPGYVNPPTINGPNGTSPSVYVCPNSATSPGFQIQYKSTSPFDYSLSGTDVKVDFSQMGEQVTDENGDPVTVYPSYADISVPFTATRVSGAGYTGSVSVSSSTPAYHTVMDVFDAWNTYGCTLSASQSTCTRNNPGAPMRVYSTLYTNGSVYNSGVFSIPLTDYRKTATFNLTIIPPGGGGNFFFSLADTSGVSVTRGGSTTKQIIVTKQNGSPQAVSLAVSGQPAGISTSLAPVTCTPNFSCTSTITISAASSAALGTTQLTVTGTAGGSTQTLTFPLTVSGSSNVTVGACTASKSPAQVGDSVTWSASVQCDATPCTYRWTTSPAITPAPATPSFTTTYTTVGTKTAQLTMTNANGVSNQCTPAGQIQVNINPTYKEF